MLVDREGGKSKVDRYVDQQVNAVPARSPGPYLNPKQDKVDPKLREKQERERVHQVTNESIHIMKRPNCPMTETGVDGY